MKKFEFRFEDRDVFKNVKFEFGNDFMYYLIECCRMIIKRVVMSGYVEWANEDYIVKEYWC